MMDVKEISKYLPHRYPFLLVDRVVELVEGIPSLRSRMSRSMNRFLTAISLGTLLCRGF